MIKKTDLRVSGEFFFRNEDAAWGWSDIRIGAELRRKINKRQDLSLGYLFQTEMYQANPERDFVVTVGYSWELKEWKRKNKKLHRYCEAYDNQLPG